MKQQELNPLQRELARGQHVAAHPDPDLLTALGEGSLLERERQQVLAHVASCAACREILSVAAVAALDSADDLNPIPLTRPSLAPHRTLLPWATAAACLLVACSAVLFYQQRHVSRKEAAVASNETMHLPSPAQQPPPAVNRNETFSKTEQHPELKQLQAPAHSQAAMTRSAIEEDKIEAAGNSDSSQEDSYESSAEPTQNARPSAGALKAAPPSSVPAFVSAAPAGMLSSVSVAPGSRPHWRINNMGHAERSFGNGTWTAVLPQEPSKMRVVSVVDGEVWIGGDNSRLYHSSDNGATWKQIALPDKGSREPSIAHIHFQTARSGVVESGDGTVWTTSDGGSTWK